MDDYNEELERLMVVSSSDDTNSHTHTKTNSSGVDASIILIGIVLLLFGLIVLFLS